MPVSDETVSELQTKCGLPPKACRAALQKSRGDIDRALAALIDAGKVTADDLDPATVSDELFGRTESQKAIGYYQHLFNQIKSVDPKSAGLPDIRKRIAISKAELRDPKKLASFGRSVRLSAAAARAPKSKKKSKPIRWSHPRWGRFKYNGLAWSAPIVAPAFNAFSYDTGYSNARKPNGKYQLRFETDDESELPSNAAVSLAEKVLANPAGLVAKIIKALWDDFTGRGPGSTLWWHDSLDQVNAAILDENPKLSLPKKSADLLPLLSFSQITVSTRYDNAKSLAELSFHAPFEGEHGVSVLTNGSKILGIGYTADVEPFD
jgi:hypothetical protein